MLMLYSVVITMAICVHKCNYTSLHIKMDTI